MSLRRAQPHRAARRAPEAAVIVEAMRGTLTGNRDALERLFDTERVAARAERWTLELVPRDLRLRGQVASVRVSGRGPRCAKSQVLLADGDRSVMTIEPRPAARREPASRADGESGGAPPCPVTRGERRRPRPATRRRGRGRALAAGAGSPLRDRAAHPLRRRPVGLPAVGADGRAGGAARPAEERQRRAPAPDRHRRRRRRRRAPTRASQRARPRAARERRTSRRSHNGDTARLADAGRFVFEHRYLLSPAVDAARFRSTACATAIDETLALLGTPAGALIKPILLRDPTGETLRIAEAMTPAQAPRSEDGVWVSRTAPRAVLVRDDAGRRRRPRRPAAGPERVAMPSRAAGVRGARRGRGGAAARALRRRQLRGRSRASGSRARSSGWRSAGGAIIVVLLWLAFASLRALAVALLPVATGVLAGIAAVSLGFGQVHGMTLGFGTTLIGEAVDYAIYYLIQAAPRRRSGGGATNRTPALAARELADGAARPVHVADRLRRAGLLRLSRPGAARRVLDRRPASPRRRRRASSSRCSRPTARPAPACATSSAALMRPRAQRRCRGCAGGVVALAVAATVALVVAAVALARPALAT